MRTRLSLFLILSVLATAGIQAQGLLPSSVQQYLNERRYIDRNRTTAAEDLNHFRYVAPRIVGGIEVVDAFIAIDNEYTINRLEDVGVMINCIFDGFVTAQIPTDRLAAVSMMPGVKDVEISGRMQLCTDSTMSATHVNWLHNGLSHHLPANYDGSGVIVGVIDMGFDFQHRAFRAKDDASRTRITRVYNTQVTTGHKVKYNKTGVLPGSVFIDDEIYSLTTDKNNNTHGTHTASIATGTHVNGYGGMAPGAEIVMCAVSQIEGAISAVEIANCVRYIDCYADSVGKPFVISLSVNTPNGQHDGQDYLSKVVKQVTGPGKLFVIAAGNNSGTYPYAHHTASTTSPIHLMFKCKNSVGGDSTYYYKNVAADVWMRPSSVNLYYKYHILDLTNGHIVWESEQRSTKSVIYGSQISDYYSANPASSDTSSYISSELIYVSQGKKYRLDITINNLMSKEYTLVGGVKRSRYALGVTVIPRRNTPCDIDAWSCVSTARFGVFNGKVTEMDGTVWDNYYSPASDACCIGTYAVGDSTISVGAYAARNSYFSYKQQKIVTDPSFTIGNIASFSSYQVSGAGPTGEALPTICAPGACVVAAASRYSYLTNSPYTVMCSEDGSYWGVMSGTSMSAPTVAGIIALWLQANPQLSVAQVKQILSQTAVRDNYTLASPDKFGPNGKIDALAGLQLILKNMQPLLMGDINCDGDVNIFDVTDLINYLLSNQAQGLDLQVADMDGDGKINIWDLTELIDCILSR